jgi:hypothetical protein
MSCHNRKSNPDRSASNPPVPTELSWLVFQTRPRLEWLELGTQQGVYCMAVFINMHKGVQILPGSLPPSYPHMTLVDTNGKDRRCWTVARAKLGLRDGLNEWHKLLVTSPKTFLRAENGRNFDVSLSHGPPRPVTGIALAWVDSLQKKYPVSAVWGLRPQLYTDN